ncbi:MAG: hypothetical protein K0U34_05480 [Alphaproteobacteria bacterium]|nr:hypothetical protein [Alphaproteobacteria bacterium]
MVTERDQATPARHVTETTLDLESRLRLEVETAHSFIAAWFRGEPPRDQHVFRDQFTSRFAADMINVQPAGKALTLDELVQSIYAGHGANSGFAIAIHDFHLLHQSADGGMATATYIEAQTGAMHTVPADNRRISTVVFALTGQHDPPVWVHLHETAIK